MRVNDITRYGRYELITGNIYEGPLPTSYYTDRHIPPYNTWARVHHQPEGCLLITKDNKHHWVSNSFIRYYKDDFLAFEKKKNAPRPKPRPRVQYDPNSEPRLKESRSEYFVLVCKGIEQTMYTKEEVRNKYLIEPTWLDKHEPYTGPYVYIYIWGMYKSILKDKIQEYRKRSIKPINFKYEYAD